MNTVIVSAVGLGCLLILVVVGVVGGPVYLKIQPKPPSCPYGKCFIDRCIRICSCIPPEGSLSCTKNFLKSSTHDCKKPASKDNNCPHGLEFRSPHWTKNFVCYCNNDVSQTYECIDTLSQQPATVRDLFPDTFIINSTDVLDFFDNVMEQQLSSNETTTTKSS